MRWSASHSAGGSSAGICTSQLGAYCRSTATRRGPSGPRQRRPSASSTGRYGSPAPYGSTHCPCPTQRSSAGGHLGDKGVHQGRLANAGLPGDDPHLPRALLCRGPPLVHLGQFRLPPDKVRRATRGGRLVRRIVPAVRCLVRRRLRAPDRRDEPIAPTVHRLDKLGGPRLIAQAPGAAAESRPSRRPHSPPSRARPPPAGRLWSRAGPPGSPSSRAPQRVSGAEGAPPGRATAVRRAGSSRNGPKTKLCGSLHHCSSHRQPSEADSVHAAQFSDFCQNFFTTSSGLCPVHQAMLRSQRQGCLGASPSQHRSIP